MTPEDDPRPNPMSHGSPATATGTDHTDSHGPAPTHGHGHGHGSLRLRTGTTTAARIVTWAAVACLVATLLGMAVLWPRGAVPLAPGVIPGTVFVEGRISEMLPTECTTDDPATRCFVSQVEVDNGPRKGDIAVLELRTGGRTQPTLRVGDRIRMSYFDKGPEQHRYNFVDFVRTWPMVVVGMLFVAVVVALSRFQGVRALLGMALSLGVLVVFLLPGLLRGAPSVPIALVAASAVAFLVLYTAHGVHHGTHVAYLGSVLSLALTGVLGSLFVTWGRFTGFGDEEALVLSVASRQINVQGLVLAGLIVGALGVLDDVTVTQVSAVSELQRADPHMSARRLYQSGLRIGRDHVASTVNTLVLAYAGASLPLLLLFAQGGFTIGQLLTSEVVGVEVVRALVGSIGLVASVPITTGLAALVVHQPATGPRPDAAAVTDAGGVADHDPVGSSRSQPAGTAPSPALGGIDPAHPDDEDDRWRAFHRGG